MSIVSDTYSRVLAALLMAPPGRLADLDAEFSGKPDSLTTTELAIAITERALWPRCGPRFGLWQQRESLCGSCLWPEGLHPQEEKEGEAR